MFHENLDCALLRARAYEYSRSTRLIFNFSCPTQCTVRCKPKVCVETKQPSYSSMASPKPVGSRPSFSSFSNAMMSCRLVAFLILSRSRAFSSSVSFILDMRDAAGASVLVSNVFVFVPMICSSQPMFNLRDGESLPWMPTLWAPLVCRTVDAPPPALSP